MTAALKAGEAVEHGLRRVVRRELGRALAALGRGDDDPTGAVHDVRKRCKRTRALLRLVRATLARDVYARETAAIREAAAVLAPLRDAAVGLLAFDQLVAQARLDPAAPDLAAIRTILAARRERVAGDRRAAGRALRQAAAILEPIRRRAHGWPLSESGFAAVTDGLKRTYAAGRHGARRAAERPEAETLHDWRKAAKTLFYQTGFLSPIWPAALGFWAGELDRLTELLGDDHDLFMLDQALDETCPGTTAPLRDVLRGRRSDLQGAALRLGRRLYAERPAAFTARHRRYWAAADGVAGPPPCPPTAPDGSDAAGTIGRDAERDPQ